MRTSRFSFFLLYLLLFDAAPSHSQSVSQSFKVTNIPKSTWIPGKTLALNCDYRYCSYLCLTNPASCSAFTIDADGQCQTGTFNTYIPLRTDGGVGMKVYVVNNKQVITGQASLLSLVPGDKSVFVQQDLSTNSLVPHVAYLAAASIVDFSLDQTASPAVTNLPSPTGTMITDSTLFNFYRSGTFYSCGGFSQKCYWARIDDATFVSMNQTMVYVHIGGVAVDMGDIFWVTGGYSADYGTSQTVTEYWQNAKWNPGPTLPAAMSYHGAVAISATQVLLYGGWDSVTVTESQSTWMYDFSTNAWTQKSSYLGSARSNMASACLTLSNGKSYAYIMGGTTASSTILNEVQQYDIQMDVWSVLSSTPLPVERNDATAVVVDNTIVIFAGENQAGTAVLTVDRYITGQGWNSIGTLSNVVYTNNNVVLYNV